MSRTRLVPLSTRPSSPAAGTTVAERGLPLGIAVHPGEDSAVLRAVDDLVRDLASSVGAATTRQDDARGARIVVGTLGASPLVDAAVADGRLDVARLHDEDGAPLWEGFQIGLVDEELYLVGTDRRGTVYAVYELAEAAGVSPWYWWGDVAVKQRDHFSLAADTLVADHPSVRYRGIFLNDEEELYHWARKHTGDDTIGPESYERIFELLLRLKGNYIWPAMHVGAFNHDPCNGSLAHEMGVVVGTSHCDMLLRSNEHEFRPWVAEQGETVEYDYSIPGHNRDMLQRYWRGSVEQNRDYEATWTVGMRGVHDSGFVTAAIDGQDLSDQQRRQAGVELLQTVIADQRALLSEVRGGEPSDSPQIFVPYKEVLDLYDAGLQVPDDVTLVWANDNFGHIRRFPSEAERARSGGNGLYYHSSYWSNMTTSYLATSSTPLALMQNELRKAWDNGIRRLWVDNVGGLKPLEIETEYFLRTAWEAGRTERTADVQDFVAAWIDEKFSGGHGAEAGAIYREYYRLNNQRKIEHLAADVFSGIGEDEASARLEALRGLDERTTAILDTLPQEERDTFFQLFAVKIHFSYLVNAQWVNADRSRLAQAQGRAAAADAYVAASRRFEAQRRALIHFYNHTMNGGRWELMFTPEAFPPPVMPMYPALSPSLRRTGRGLGAFAQDQVSDDAAPALRFDAFGAAAKWVDLYSTGAEAVDFTVTADPWITVSETAGTVATESRLWVSVTDEFAASRAGRILVTDTSTGAELTIVVAAAAAPVLPTGFVGAVEADGAVSLAPARPDGATGVVATLADAAAGGAAGVVAHPVAALGAEAGGWRAVPYLGRYGVPAVEARGAAGSGVASGRLDYTFHLSTAGEHELQLDRLPTLNATGAIRVLVGVDDLEPVEVSSEITDEKRGGWELAIQDNVDRLRVRLPRLEAGTHTLRVHAVDAGVVIMKLFLRTRPAPASNLGPAFSYHTATGRTPVLATRPSAADSGRLDAVANRLYRTDVAAVPLPDQVYAGEGFWEGDTTFRRNLAVPQERLGAPRYASPLQGERDVVALLGTGTWLESGGRLAIEAESALSGDDSSWRTPGAGGEEWTHTLAESDGGTGLAMHVTPRGRVFADPAEAPGLHYALRVGTEGSYRAWFLLKYDDAADDAFVLALDGEIQDPSEQFSGGEMCSYGTRQLWLWALVTELELDAGDHTLSLLARKSGLRVDRVYLTTGDELPPVDAEWRVSTRSPEPSRQITGA